jgi:hypothetical protein
MSKRDRTCCGLSTGTILISWSYRIDYRPCARIFEGTLTRRLRAALLISG